MSTFGVVLVVVGAALMVAEAHVPTHGLLATAATAALVTGLVLALSGAGVPVAAVISVGLVTALAGLALAAVIVRASLAVRRRSIRSGPRALIGRIGTVRAVPDPLGQVLVDGALWRGRAWGRAGGGAVAAGGAAGGGRGGGVTLTVPPPRG